VQASKDAVSKKFDVKDLVELKWILGVEVIRNRGKRILEINQRVYIEKMLERFGMADCNYVLAERLKQHVLGC